jgi:hypothetical protein
MTSMIAFTTHWRYRALPLLVFVGLLALLGSSASAQLSNYSLFDGINLQAYDQGISRQGTGNDSYSVLSYDNSGALVASATANDSSTFGSNSFSSSLNVQQTNLGIELPGEVAEIGYEVQFDITPGYYSFNETYSFDPGNGYATPGLEDGNVALVYQSGGGADAQVLSYAPWQDNVFYESPASGTFGWSGFLNAGLISVGYGMGVGDGNLLPTTVPIPSSGSATASVFFGAAQAQATPEPSGAAALCCGVLALFMCWRTCARARLYSSSCQLMP